MEFIVNFLLNSLLKYINFIILKKKSLNFLTLIIEKNSILPVITFGKECSILSFKTLSDICIIDYPNRNSRFEINYNLLSVENNVRIFLKTYISTYVDSVSHIFNSSNWMERECWDMFGIYFLRHPDLRRILTDYGFEGFPLRKDFPLIGYLEVRYDDELSSIVYEPIEMAQEYRLFNFISP